MTFIDWSDAEGMFGLLVEYVADENAGSARDSERGDWLSGVLRELRTFEARIDEVSPSALVEGLHRILDSSGREFLDDPVAVHLRHLIEELDRIEDEVL